jgi:hypothetical protein
MADESIGRNSWFVAPGNVGPDQPAAFVAVDAAVRGQALDYEQAAAVFASGIIDNVRPDGCAAVGDRDPHRQPVPGDLDRELAAVTTAGVADGVAAQLVRHGDDVVAGGAGWE